MKDVAHGELIDFSEVNLNEENYEYLSKYHKSFGLNIKHSEFEHYIYVLHYLRADNRLANVSLNQTL